MRDFRVGWEVFLLLGILGGAGVVATGVGVVIAIGFPDPGWWTLGGDPQAMRIEPLRAATGMLLSAMLVATAVKLFRREHLEDESDDPR